MEDENTFDNAVDAANIFEEEPDGTGLSWSFTKINEQVDDEGRMCGTDQDGRKSKVRLLMLVQIVLAIYYAVGYGLLLGESNNYYVWPPPPSDDVLSAVNLTIRSEEESFLCDGTTYYRECQGPKYENVTIEGCSSGYGDWFISLSFWVVFICLVIFFCFRMLYRGLYNSLLGLTSFQVKKDIATQSYARPAKFAVAFTLFCNFAKGTPSSLKSEACGRLVLMGGDFNSLFEGVLALIYLLCFAIIFLLVLGYGINLICGRRCCCCFGWCPKSSTFLIVTFCRFVLLAAVVSQFMLRFVRFNWEVDFDWNYPSWAALSIVSWVDLLLSLLADVYLGFVPWIRKIHQSRRHRQVHQQAKEGSAHSDSSDAEEEL